MNMTKTKTILTLALALLMAFQLAACSVSSSSSSTVSVSTSKTDADGNTTTNTTTTQVGVTAGSDGVSTTHETSTETTTTGPDEAEDEAEGAALAEHLYALYNVGAEGSNADGDRFFYAYSEESDDALLVIVSADGTHYNGWEGVTETVDEHVVLSDGDTELPFTFTQEDGEEGFTMNFLGDGDAAEMQFVDMDVFVKDLVAARMAFN